MTGVFISHVPADTDTAIWLAGRLSATGARVFLREWVEPGLVPLLEQEQALTTASHGILLISRATMADPAVREEYAALVHQARTAAGHRFIPVLVGEITDVELPRFAAIRKPIDLRDASGSESPDARLEALLRLLGRRTTDGRPALQPLADADDPDDRIRILLLAANPCSTARLAIDEEARAIVEKIRLSRDRDRFNLITCWAVRPADLLDHLNRHDPQVVHFSGHGQRAGDIVLAAGDGTARSVDPLALGELFRVMKDRIRVVVLNACYSAVQARAIGQHVDYIVGMRASVTDEAATVLAAAFYSALGFRRTIPQAFEQASTALRLHGMPGHDIPELLVRPGADPYLK